MPNEYRIWRAPRSDFAGLVSHEMNDLTDETYTAATTYDDDELSAIAESGFNAIWVHGLLQHIVNVEPFPELGKNHLMHKVALREVIGRAARHGIKVFIYMQPPRSVTISNREFWDRHPEVGGQEELRDSCDDDSIRVTVRALCTSTEPVRAWLKNAASQLVEELPGLGGIILITSSEFPAHCYSKRQKDDPRCRIECPNCRTRHPADIVVEIINLIRDGVREVSAETAVVAWNWSWTMWGIKPPCREIIDRLPSDVILMADFERGGYKDMWQRPRHYFNEYSLTYAGPSELCLGSFDVAGKRGMPTMSKLQFGTTHELATVVNLPLMRSVFQKAFYQKYADTTGFMGCWNFGNFTSTNTNAFNYFLSADCPDDETDALVSFAKAFFPGCDAPLLAECWQKFTEAMEYYPFCIPLIYNGPMNHTLAYTEMYVPGKLTGKKAGPGHYIVDRGDDLSDTFEQDTAVFPLDEIITRFDKLKIAWDDVLDDYIAALASCPAPEAAREVGSGAICGAVWHSTANTYKVFRLRRDWDKSLRNEFMDIVRDELEVLPRVLPYVEADSRQGYHGEARGHMFDPQSIKNKISVLEGLLK